MTAVECRVGELEEPLLALLDTGAEWCVLDAEVTRELGLTSAPGSPLHALHTRFGLLHGTLERIPLQLTDSEGQSLEIDATWFVSPDWPSSTVLGWRGGLERLRFAVDPNEEWFYFAAL